MGGGGDFFLSFLGDDGGKRPTPQQMAMATAVKSRENEIRQDMAKFFKNETGNVGRFQENGCGRQWISQQRRNQEGHGRKFQTWGHVDDETFDKVDLNDDGKISIDEFLKWSL